MCPTIPLVMNIKCYHNIKFSYGDTALIKWVATWIRPKI